MASLKVTQIGNSVGVVLPKEVLAKLNVRKGDELFLSDAPHGIRLTTIDPQFEEQMAIARKIMKKRRHVLAELAK